MTVCIHFLLAPVEGLFFKPKYRANKLYLFSFHCCFIYFPLIAVGISLPFFAQYLLILTDPGLQRSGTILHWCVVVILPPDINHLLTEREGRTGEYCRARGRDSTDRASRGAHKNDRGPIFPSTARASQVSKQFIIWHSAKCYIYFF